mmetsp:Transcript_25598/g.102052  ORF Transcript_25598/g.102052 Transcript_25598/m.102052 type:complete len:232 (+) Transcript_25598:4067-4762(+)
MRHSTCLGGGTRFCVVVNGIEASSVFCSPKVGIRRVRDVAASTTSPPRDPSLEHPLVLAPAGWSALPLTLRMLFFVTTLAIAGVLSEHGCATPPLFSPDNCGLSSASCFRFTFCCRSLPCEVSSCSGDLFRCLADFTAFFGFEDCILARRVCFVNMFCEDLGSQRLWRNCITFGSSDSMVLATVPAWLLGCSVSAAEVASALTPAGLTMSLSALFNGHRSLVCGSDCIVFL